MAFSSPFSTPDHSPVSPEVTESSNQWSDVILEEFRGKFHFQTPPTLVGKYGYTCRATWKTRFGKSSRFVWISVLFLVFLWWATNGTQKSLFEDEANSVEKMKSGGLKYIDGHHPHIRYVGRWLSSADGTHRDSSFAGKFIVQSIGLLLTGLGTYFEFTVNSSASVLISLHNLDQQRESSTRKAHMTPNLSFLPLTNTTSAGPISLLARIDDDEYIIFPHATGVIQVRRNDLSLTSLHNIRIIAPMVGNDKPTTLQVKGIWIDEGAELIPYEHTLSGEEIRPAQHGREPTVEVAKLPAKLLELVTDLPGGAVRRSKQKTTSYSHHLLGGVTGWDYLLGEMFGSGHVTISMDGMCLIPNCLGGRGSPAGLADVFFQSGPVGSAEYNHAWTFQDYTPDVIARQLLSFVMNIGSSDWDSFQTHIQEYNKTLWDLSAMFEETYVTLIRAIRNLAYPKYSTTTHSTHDLPSLRSLATDIPIFIMRPFRGQLEQATHTVVDRLRKDGDRSVFWLDTSGWLNTDVAFDGPPEDQDFFLDEESPSKQWRLTERANQKVAVLLHMHVCQYLARDINQCAFLPPESYEGKALDHEAIRFEEFLEDERERKLKKLFWV